jgi:hypothetical protein
MPNELKAELSIVKIQTREMLDDRLQELAQKYCADVVQKEISDTVTTEEI